MVNKALENTVALFPGQGSQYVGMAKALYDEFHSARLVFEEAADSIHIDLKRLCFEGPESELVLTENTQPTLLTASIAAFRVASSEIGFKPSMVAGHSLGEYSALVAAGALSLGQAVCLVRERGLAMQRAVPAGEGAMAAILGLEDERVQNLCIMATEQAKHKRELAQISSKNCQSVEAIVEPANYNSPGQVVIAGSEDAVAEASMILDTDPEWSGGRAIMLSVSAPFHCRLMAKARSHMAEKLAGIDSRHLRLACPYIPNRTARPTQEASLIFELLVDQIDHPVLWKQTMFGLLDSGYEKAIEFGPGKVLSSLAKRISQYRKMAFSCISFSDPGALKVLDV